MPGECHHTSPPSSKGQSFENKDDTSLSNDIKIFCGSLSEYLLCTSDWRRLGCPLISELCCCLVLIIKLRSYNIESNKRVRGCVATFKHLLAAARYGGNSDLQSADDHASGAVTDNWSLAAAVTRQSASPVWRSQWRCRWSCHRAEQESICCMQCIIEQNRWFAFWAESQFNS